MWQRGIPAHRAAMAETLADLMGGKSVVIAVVSTPAPDVRHWIVTAWVTGKLPKGGVEWKRP